MGTGWHPKPTPSSPRKRLTDATHRPKAKCSWVSGVEPGLGAPLHPQGPSGWPLTRAFPGPGTPLPSLFFSFLFFFNVGRPEPEQMAVAHQKASPGVWPALPGGRKPHVLLTESPSPQGLEARLQSRSPAGGGKGPGLPPLEGGHQVTQPTRCQSWGLMGSLQSCSNPEQHTFIILRFQKSEVQNESVLQAELGLVPDGGSREIHLLPSSSVWRHQHPLACGHVFLTSTCNITYSALSPPSNKDPCDDTGHPPRQS